MTDRNRLLACLLLAVAIAACAPRPRATSGEVPRDERGQAILTAPR